ncbi:endonuclease/exonuclease/phosphatase family protein [Streptomyces sp. NPDC006265]|uniref:endonuclease/exonuclease/phosphatase family protein n=1 Tax=Streptomyces sp. NPDC006265 TaxID=3156740 RepID=UPI0033A16D46
MTWNLWWHFGPWQTRQKAILTALRELRPDVVGLQEVWAADGENLAEWLAGELGLHCAWGASPAPERWQRRIGARRSASAMRCSAGGRSSTRTCCRCPLPPRTTTAAWPSTPAWPLPVTKCPSSPPTSPPTLHASAVRCRHVAAVAEFVARHRGDTPFPPVVTGDLNAWPDSDEVRLLGGYKTAPTVPGKVLVDAWEYADPAAPSATWDAANPHVTPARRPGGRIDYIHVGPPGPGGLGRVRDVRRACDGPVDGVWPSDHTVVVADLEQAT